MNNTDEYFNDIFIKSIEQFSKSIWEKLQEGNINLHDFQKLILEILQNETRD